MLKLWLFKNVFMQVCQLYFKLNLKPVKLDLATKKGIVLAPHPDDESIGMGGTLALYSKNLDVICVSSGQKVKNKNSSNEGVNSRKKELENALTLAGVETFVCLDIPDQEILTHYECFKTLNFSDVDIIFLPNLLDQHPDHKALAWHLSRYIKDFPKKVKPTLQIAFYEVWNALALPNAFVDISSVADTKRAMINAHASQEVSKAYADKMLGLNAYRGLLKNVDYAEVFSVVDIQTFQTTVSTLCFFEETSFD
jgi:LmbE family N-acetylglucosaminyl deacetylase